MRLRSTLAVAIVAVVALTGVAAGCGGSDDEPETSPTAEWADGFCNAITGWTTDMQSITEQFSDTSNLSSEGLRSAAGDARGATEDLIDDLKGLGAPDTESGDEVRSALDSLSTTLDSETASIQETADGVSSIVDLPGAISKISSSLSALGTALSQTLQSIEEADVSNELESALQDSPACADITSG